MIKGKLELTIKINELPQPNTVGKGLQQFGLNCDEPIISVTVKCKIYKKLTNTASSNYLQWVAAMSNDKPRSVYALNLGQQTQNGLCWMNPIYKFSSASLNQRQKPRLVMLEPG